MIRIGFFGDGIWAHKTFNRLASDESIIICFVTVRYSNQDQILINLAQRENIPVELSGDINSEEFLERIRKYNVDLFVSMSFDQIFRTRTINFPRFKTINCHAGKLPFYRGRNILNWALINDEKEFGITVHYVDEGIDTGDIILQKCYPISDDDDYNTLLSKAYEGCSEVLYNSIKMIHEGVVKPIKQSTIDPIGMYCGKRCEGDEVINWNQSSREVFNFVRAICTPGPMAVTSHNGNRFRINKVKEVIGAKPYVTIPGQIIGKTENGFMVKTRDTFVEVIEYEYEGIIKVGDRLL